MDHDIDVYERQDGEQLVYLKVVKCFEENPHVSHLGNHIYTLTGVCITTCRPVRCLTDRHLSIYIFSKW